MNRKICPCGRSVYGLGHLCAVCLDARRRVRAAEPRKFPVIERIDADRRPAHMSWIRTLPCAVPGCPHKSEATHVRLNTGGGMGLKPDDRWCIPLCHAHHGEQHQIGHGAFDAKHGINSRALAEELAAESPFLRDEAAA